MNALATKSGLSQAMISTFEAKNGNPTLDSLLRISRCLGVDLGRLISKAIRLAEKKEAQSS